MGGMKIKGIRLPNGAEAILALVLVVFDALLLNLVFTELFTLWLRKTPQIEIYLASFYQVRWHLLGIYILFSVFVGSFSIRRLSTAADSFTCVLRSLLLTFISFYVLAFFSRELANYAYTFPRPVFLLSALGSLFAAFLLRVVISAVFKPYPRLVRAIIIGDISEGRRIIKHIHRRGGVRYRLVKTLKKEEVNELAAETLLKHVHEIFVTDPSINLDKFWSQIYYSRKASPHFFEVKIPVDTKKASIGAGLFSLEDYPLISIPSLPLSNLQLFAKRFFDICFSIFSLIILAPIMLIVAILVKLDSPGPIFYKQRRVGRYGKDYDVIKFRSMRTGAEAKNGPVVSGADDPRISSFGKFIRHFGLDELPQFFLVLTGDMSVVGPRPERPFFVDNYFEFQGRRLAVKPGVTGLAAVNSRYYLRLVDKVTYDYFYLNNYSMLLDVKIIIQTVWVLLFKTENPKVEIVTDGNTPFEPIENKTTIDKEQGT
jgi:exopolysaccharide biosynthesis polyprenyl glycosylphosphotransferase